MKGYDWGIYGISDINKNSETAGREEHKFKKTSRPEFSYRQKLRMRVTFFLTRNLRFFRAIFPLVDFFVVF